MSSAWLILISVAIVVLSAFFVAVEFSLIAAKRHRFEEMASTSAGARAALRSSRDLTLLLAGSQLGITVCTLALGALTKPAVHHALTPVLTGWGLPSATADVVAFVLALFVVTFIHLVIGEMMPKSIAIAHPERAAVALAIPMRIFMFVFRPLLVVLNGFANWLLRRFGVEPADEVAESQDPHGLRQLIDHSVEAGTLDPDRRSQIEGALGLFELRLGELVKPRPSVTRVAEDARIADVWSAADSARHLRVLVGTPERFVGSVHVRDTLTRNADEPITDLVADIARFDADVRVADALASMQEARQHLAVVHGTSGFIGVVTLSDMLQSLFPNPEAESLA